MAEHLFLCGLSDAQRATYKGGRELNLHGPKANVRLKLDDIRRNFLMVEPALLADLIEIAAYVFAADCSVSRGGITFPNAGSKWRRTFHLVVAVREPGRWSEPGLLKALREALEFLSDDTWNFTFEEMANPPPIQTYLNFAEPSPERSGDTSIVLFSGGLDSYAGAVHELTQTNRHVVLMSRRIEGMTIPRQAELADEIRKRYRRRVTHVSLNAGLTKETAAREHTQRTRTFLLAAMALVAAVMESADRVRFYENGIMSVNLPISGQVVGSRASRSTHPRSLMLLERLGGLIAAPGIKIDNPFIWSTKAEIVSELLQHPESRAISRTLSCSKTREMTLAHPHCGTCAQCLQRRISTLGANAGDLDPKVDYAVDLLVGARHGWEDTAMAVETIRSALEFWRMSEREIATRFSGELGSLATCFENDAPESVARKCADLFKRHGDTVHDILVRAHKEYAQAIFDETLPDTCLVRLAPHSMAPATSVAHHEVPALGKADEPTAGAAAHETSEIMLAIDTDLKQVIIEGIAHLRGSTDFRLFSVLARMHIEDRENGLLPINFRTLSGDALADAVSGANDTAARKAIERIRKRIAADWSKLFGGEPEPNAVIENVSRKGYRLNPQVRVVSPDQLRNR